MLSKSLIENATATVAELVQTEIEKLTKSLIEKIEKNNDALLRIDAFNDEKDSMIEYMKSQLREAFI